MESILELLCDAPIGCNACPRPQDSSRLENVKSRIALIKRLRAQLTPEQNALLDEYYELEDQAMDDTDLQTYKDGFCLGASLILEVFQGRNRLLGR